MNISSVRPCRTAISDALGRRITLNSGPEAFHIIGPFQAGAGKPPLLVLGTGAEPDALAAWLDVLSTQPQKPAETAMLAAWPTPPQSRSTDTVPLFRPEAPRIPAPLFQPDAPGVSTPIFWLDAPRVTAALRLALPHFPPLLPPRWQAVSPEEARRLLPLARICWFRQNCRVDEPFWRELHGALLALEGGLACAGHSSAASCASPVPASCTPPTAALCAPRQRSVLLPADAGSLLSRELTIAFRELGFTPRALPARPNLPALAALLHSGVPDLCCSVNLRGFDGEGAVFHLLRACGIPCAAWLVDNPWHLLSGISQPWWRELALFVTDDSFIAPLQSYGARCVQHLPLAAAQHMRGARQSAGGTFSALATEGTMPQQAGRASAVPAAGSHGGRTTTPTAMGSTQWNTGSCVYTTPAAGERTPLLFIGSSHFAGKDQFFAAARVPETLLQEGLHLTSTGGRADAAWWQAHLQEQLWPAHGARRVGLGAEICSQACRAAWLTAAAPLGLTVHGDAGWQGLVPPTVRLLPPVEYYTDVPALYRQAACTLNVTSLLLPHGLTQRHFDVWAAGGFLLTDATAGLALFPQELTAPISVERPEMLADAVARLRRAPAAREALRHAWQEEIDARHSYTHRLAVLLHTLEQGKHEGL